MTTMQNQELRTEIISESVDGRPVHISTDYTTASDVTPLHVMTVDDVIDAVYLECHNSYSSNINLNLILNPADTTSTASIDAATITVTVPRYGSAWVLQGQKFRLVSGTSYTIAAYVATAYVNYLHITGWYNRIKSSDLTA